MENSNLSFDPAALVQVEFINPVTAKAARISKPKARFTAKVTESGVRFYISAELSETLSLGIGENGINVLTDPNNSTTLVLKTVPEEGAQLLAKAATRKSRNFAAHAIAQPLIAQGLIGSALGEYTLDLEAIEGHENLYVVINDDRMEHNLTPVEDTGINGTDELTGINQTQEEFDEANELSDEELQDIHEMEEEEILEEV
jgi:hypothetical protein